MFERRATFEDFTISGPDLEGDITGYIQLAAELERWGPRAHLRFKFSDKFLEDHRDVKTAMTSIPYLRNGQKDGYTGFAVTGAFGKLKWSPRKDSPYKSAARGSRAPEPDAEGDDEDAKARPAPVDRRAKGRTDRPRGLDTARTDKPTGAEAAEKAARSSTPRAAAPTPRRRP
ncbi:MAG: hypothetical protein R3F43_24470 [bacterium]